MKKKNVVVKLTSRDGGALVVVMMIMVVMVVLGLSKLSTAGHAATEAMREESRSSSFAFAEMGINHFQAIVIENLQPFHKLNLLRGDDLPILDEDVEGGVVDGVTSPDGSYRVFVMEEGSVNIFKRRYKIVSIGEADGDDMATVITVHAQRSTLAEDLMASHTDGGVNYVTGDHIYGSVRSNNKYYILGNPVFHDKIKTSASVISVDGSDKKELSDRIALGGIEFDVKKIDFNSDLITEMKEFAGKIIDRDCVIEFLPDGEYSVTTTDQETYTETVITGYRYWDGRWWRTRDSLNRVPSRYRSSAVPVTTEQTGTRDVIMVTTNLIADLGDMTTDEDNVVYVEGTATVKGEVSGAISVVASDQIRVDGNVVYSSKRNDRNPSNWNKNDINDLPAMGERLGLYAKNRVMIVNAKQGVDVYIHGAIFTTEEGSSVVRGFCVEQYTQDLRKNGQEPYIHIFGSIIQHTRGAVGQWGGKGFLKNYHQDYRFKEEPPPGSPPDVPYFYDWSVERIQK